MISYPVDIFSSAASAIWLAMAGKPPRGADKIFPIWLSELLGKLIPEGPHVPRVGEENRVGNNGCSLLCSWGVDPVWDMELLCPGLGSLKLVKTACGDKLSLWLPPDPPELDPENYYKTKNISRQRNFIMHAIVWFIPAWQYTVTNNVIYVTVV